MSDDSAQKSSSKYKKTDNTCRDELPHKQFIPRNSLLNDLYQDKNVQTVLHVFVMILLGQFLHSAATDLIYTGRLNLGVDLIQRCFVNFYWITVIWLCLFISTVSVYFFFRIWATVRTTLKFNTTFLKIWDTIWIGIAIVYYLFFLSWPVVALHVCNIQPAAKFGFSCEILRLLMKTHAFIRSNAPKVLEQGNKTVIFSKFKTFMYFLWAPTLLYRESYPRTTTIRWRFIFIHVLKFIAVIFFASFLFEKYIINVFKDYGRKPFVWQEVVIIVCENVPAGMGMMLGLFFVIQHAWMNICAELLTFADRLFYQDWWSATSYKDFYRKWNVLVQDWLYTYIYKDIFEIIIPKNKNAANCIIFFISALAHEYITGLSFGFFLPILFVFFFGFGRQFVYLEFNNPMIGNVFVYFCLALGMSFISAVFSIEYFYRVNCPEENVTFCSYVTPRFFTCPNTSST